MPISSKFRAFFLIWLLMLSGSAGYAGADTLKDELASIDADIVFMRHALAPGTGDPASFDITDCNSQRNLDAAGRRQARQAGEALKRSGIKFYQILSSRWCRCTETAALLDLGAFTTFDGLNSFFDGQVDRQETLSLLAQKLAKTKDNTVTLMVTHQVVIGAITGISPPSGGLVLYNSRTQQSKQVRF